MDGYYDYHPTLTLPRPVALVGFFGAGTAEVAAIVSQRTGVAVAELDRWIEHEAGRSLSALVLQRGLSELRRIETKLLPRAIAQQPPPLIALGDGALLSDDNRALVLRETELVYLRADPRVLLPRIQNDVGRWPGSMYPFLHSAPRTVEDVLPLFDEREPGYVRAPHVLDVAGRSSSDVAAQLLDLLRSQDVAAAH